MSKVGAKKKKIRKFLKANASIKISLPKKFVPSREKCKIKIVVTPATPMPAPFMVNLDIKNKDNKAVRKGSLGMVKGKPGIPGLFKQFNDEYEWDGKDSKGKYVGPDLSPYKAIVSIITAPMIKAEKSTKVELHSIKFGSLEKNKKFQMNNPAEKKKITTHVRLKNKWGAGQETDVPIPVKFSFVENAGNTAKNDSYEYTAGKFLGKKDDGSASFWEEESGYKKISKDKKTIVMETGAGGKRGTAVANFLPSGVGRDKFNIKATVYASDGTTKLGEAETGDFEVYRKVTFNCYEMKGQKHVSRHGTDRKMAKYYKKASGVTYKLGSVNKIANKYSVKYIGLWDHGADKQKNWSNWQKKKADETPTNDEKTESNKPMAGVMAGVVAVWRALVEAKANKWRDRIIAQYSGALQNWATDAGVPRGSMVSIEYEHPKYSAAAPKSDWKTNEWGAYPWLRIEVEGSKMHPDQMWVSGEGLSYGGRAYITAGMSRRETEVTIAHEAGHETKNQFKRTNFSLGNHTRPEDSDHTRPGSGLMDPTGSRHSFTAGENRVLRGRKS